eukprot:Lankesteria_metandrocarpae@DN9691_c0_g1_i1.p1
MGLCCSAEPQPKHDIFADDFSIPSRTPPTEARTRANPTLEDIGTGIDTGRRRDTEPTQHELTFAKRLEVSAVPVLLLLATGFAIECDITFEREKRVLVLRNEVNRREVHFNDVQSAISTTSEMSKIQIKADIAHDINCCAILMRDRKCLTLRFDTSGESSSFVSLVKDYLSTNK